MSEQVVITLITIVVGGLIAGGFNLLLKRIDLKASEASAEVNRATLQITSQVETIKGMEILLNNQRIDADRKDHQIEVLQKEINFLEGELEDMTIQLDRLRKDKKK